MLGERKQCDKPRFLYYFFLRQCKLQDEQTSACRPQREEGLFDGKEKGEDEEEPDDRGIRDCILTP
jgi:hypothetical protein